MGGYSRCSRHDRLYPEFNSMCDKCIDEVMAARKRDRQEYERDHPTKTVKYEEPICGFCSVPRNRCGCPSSPEG